MNNLLVFVISIAAIFPLGQADLREESKCQGCVTLCTMMKISEEKVQNSGLTIWNREIVSVICKNKAKSSNCYKYLGHIDKLYKDMNKKATDFIDEHRGCASLCQSLLPLEMGETCKDPSPEEKKQMKEHFEESGQFNVSKVHIQINETYLPTCAECQFGYKLIKFLLGDINDNGGYYVEEELEHRVKPLMKAIEQDFQCKSACKEIILDAFKSGKEPLKDFLARPPEGEARHCGWNSVSSGKFCYEIQRCSDLPKNGEGSIQRGLSLAVLALALLLRYPFA